MKLIYGKVQLDLETIDRCERTAVMTPDGTTLLYTEWQLAVSCVYHPAAQWDGTPYSRHMGGTSVTSATANSIQKVRVPASQVLTGGEAPKTAIGNPPNVPLAGRDPSPRAISMPGSAGPVLTDRVLQMELAIPRQKLIITAFDSATGQEVVWLQSPADGFDRDAKHGPIVQASPVVAIQGDGQSFGVQLLITTWVPPCPYGSDRPILAHRWQMSHLQDTDHYLTRQVVGEIYFNAAVLERPGNEERADFLTPQLFHPIPLGFRRHIDYVRRSPDGTVIQYGYSDTDPTIVFDPHDTHATHLEIIETSAYIAPSTVVSYAVPRIRKFFGDLLGKNIGGE